MLTDIDRNKLIGERVRFYRTSKGWSLERMSRRLPAVISQQQLSKYENGDSRWPADLLAEIAVLMRVDIRLLTGLEDGKHEGKDNDEWESEKYRCRLMEISPPARAILYRSIDGMRKMERKKANDR